MILVFNCFDSRKLYINMGRGSTGSKKIPYV
nr:MAG TPA: hypothetical protein [Caudoviricetes sp.]